MRQLEKLHDVMKIIDHSLEKFVDRELVLVKVAISPDSRVEVRQIAEDFRSRIVDVGRHALTFEVTGDEGKTHRLYRADAPVRDPGNHANGPHCPDARQQCRYRQPHLP